MHSQIKLDKEHPILYVGAHLYHQWYDTFPKDIHKIADDANANPQALPAYINEHHPHYDNIVYEQMPSPISVICSCLLNANGEIHKLSLLRELYYDKLIEIEVDEATKTLLVTLIKASANWKHHQFIPIIKEWQDRRTAVSLGMFGHRLRDESYTESPLATFGLLNKEHQAFILDATYPIYSK